ncbi:MAG: histidine phosphatase family protein [Actinomycetales bacterium]
MTGEVTVLLVRHGQSTWNAEHRFQGQADAPLSEAGRAQAKEAAGAVAAWLAGRDAVVVSSDLERARATAEVLADAIDAAPPTTDPELREVRAGAWEGLLHPEIEAGWPELYRRWRAREDVPAGGDERASEAGRRVAAALRRHAAVAGRRPGRVLVAVGHGASLRAAMSPGLGWPEAHRQLGNLGNAHRSELVVPAGGEPWQLVTWNVPPA